MKEPTPESLGAPSADEVFEQSLEAIRNSALEQQNPGLADRLRENVERARNERLTQAQEGHPAPLTAKAPETAPGSTRSDRRRSHADPGAVQNERRLTEALPPSDRE